MTTRIPGAEPLPKAVEQLTGCFLVASLLLVAGPAAGESDRFGWHWGFAAAGIGMLVGLVQFQLGRSRLGEAGRSPPYQSSNTGAAWSGLAAAVALAALLLASEML